MVRSEAEVAIRRPTAESCSGEMMQVDFSDGSKAYLEQTCHHPPITSYYLDGPESLYKLWGFTEFGVKFGYNKSLSMPVCLFLCLCGRVGRSYVRPSLCSNSNERFNGSLSFPERMRTAISVCQCRKSMHASSYMSVDTWKCTVYASFWVVVGSVSVKGVRRYHECAPAKTVGIFSRCFSL